MVESYKDIYKALLLDKAEKENWQITVESDSDAKLYEMLIGQPMKSKKQKKKMSMENVVFIVFGKPAVDELLNKGFKSLDIASKKPTKK